MSINVVRVFVGCAANHEDLESQSVFEWSLRKHATIPVSITWMRLSTDPESRFYCNTADGKGWRTELWATPFSGFRWAVPALAGYEGQAIYFDSDFIVFADIKELMEQPFLPGKWILAKGGAAWRLCCSKWDCSEARKHLPLLDTLQSVPSSHRQLTQQYGSSNPAIQSFQGDWNNLDGKDGVRLDDPNLKAFHYTKMNSQPQLEYAIPRLKAAGLKHWYDAPVQTHARKDVRNTFRALLEEAKANGFPPKRYMDVPLFGKYKKRSFAL